MSVVKFAGSCECGHCSYTCDTFPESSGTCHCITCQKLSGSSSMSFVPVPRASLTWTHEPVVMKQSPDARRLGCEHCQSWMVMVYDTTRDRYSLNIPTVNFEGMSEADVQKFKPSHHIFVEQKAVWYDISDGCPQYHRFRADSHRKVSTTPNV